MKMKEETTLHENTEESCILKGMRDARDSPAVHKMMLATIRAHNSECLVFVCEGVDDKKVYFHWLRYIRPLLSYEFQVCNGKGKLLEFRKLLKKDTSGLDENVYFFVDHDFDGFREYNPGKDVYMSDGYSFENFIVNKEVLNKILCVELHCNGDNETRDAVLSAFDKVYNSFLNITRPHNERIFLARHLGIQIKPLPTRLSKLARVNLISVTHEQENAVEVIKLEREPTQEEILSKKAEFDKLDPQQWYRGKFAFLFFLRWIDLLGNDRNEENPILFSKAYKSSAKANGKLSLDSVAAKSIPPKSFLLFIESINSVALTGTLPAVST